MCEIHIMGICNDVIAGGEISLFNYSGWGLCHHLPGRHPLLRDPIQ